MFTHNTATVSVCLSLQSSQMPGCPAADSLAAAQVPLPSPWQHKATREAVGGGAETGRILPGFGWVTITLQLQTSRDSVFEGLRRPVTHKAVTIAMEPGCVARSTASSRHDSCSTLQN